MNIVQQMSDLNLSSGHAPTMVSHVEPQMSTYSQQQQQQQQQQPPKVRNLPFCHAELFSSGDPYFLMYRLMPILWAAKILERKIRIFVLYYGVK